MRILGLTARNSGCGFHRVILPLGYLYGTKAFVTDVPTHEKLAEGWDIILYNRISIFDNRWAELKENYKVVLDLDDDWILPPSHINYHQYRIIQPRIESNIRQADLVTVTNERLAARVRTLNSNVVILPNALPYGEHQFTDTRQESDKVRIFWAGGSSHEPDLAILRNPIKRLYTYKDKIEMVLGGYTDTDAASRYVWNRMASHFTANLPHKLLAGSTPDHYMWMYEHADIMVIPLEDTEWHGSKSNLKMLEAASKRIPCIVSNVEPYSRDKDAPVLWVNNQRDWYEHLSYLINNPEERIKQGNLLYEWAKEKYSIQEVNRTREKEYRNLTAAPALL